MTKETIIIDPVLETSLEVGPVVEQVQIIVPRPIPVPGPIGLVVWQDKTGTTGKWEKNPLITQCNERI